MTRQEKTKQTYIWMLFTITPDFGWTLELINVLRTQHNKSECKKQPNKKIK